LQSVEDFRTALRDQQSRVYELGVEDVVPTLRAPAEGDFRLNPKSLAVDRGAVTFVPWGLYGTVGEWQFYPTGNEPTMILDEHWRANDYLTHRDGFVNRPTYPLTAVRSEASDFIDGPLENFTRGALKFDRRRKSYATISDAQLKSPFTARLATRSEHGQDPQLQPFTFEGEALKTPEIYRGNFLVEVFFRAEGNGLLVQKRSDAGYAIGVREGRVKFEIQGDDGSVAKVTSNTKVADGKWHHLIVEADRNKKSLAIYVDGRMDQEAAGLANVSLSNSGDLFVGGTPEGDTLDGAIDFLRIAQGTLADAQTTIEELYAWQFHGPARHDMRGATAKGKGRDAGALESY
jgi:hypothetical protein